MKEFWEVCQRNEGPIAQVLEGLIADHLEGPKAPLVLEVGSGTGQHAVAFGRRFPKVQWQPTNRPGQLESIAAWQKDAQLSNVRPPQAFELFDDEPPIKRADMLMAINVIHIAPFEATERLFNHGAKLLDPGGIVFLYGPYRYEERPLEPSNQRFDEMLKDRDAASGIRLFEDVDKVAAAAGFRHGGTQRLPANNDAHWWYHR